MSIRILPCNHLLLVENGLQEFDDEGSCLAIIDDHGPAADQPEPRLTTIALPKPDNTGIERELERWAPRIREHSLSDAYEAMAEVLISHGLHHLTDDILAKVRAIAEQEKVPEGWTAWAAIPPGSISAFGDGQVLAVWPEPVGRLNAARFELYEPEDPVDAVTGPDFTFNAGRPSVPWVKVLRSKLTAEQIGAVLAAPTVAGETVEAAIDRLLPREGA